MHGNLAGLMHLRFLYCHSLFRYTENTDLAVKTRYRYSALVIKTKRTIWAKGRIQTEERTVPAKSAYRRRKGVGCRRATVFWKAGRAVLPPRLNSIVSVHYKGTLINGRSLTIPGSNCPEAFRLNEVIDGWQIALQQMRVGDHWMVYIPYTVGYGTRTSGPIPAFSTDIRSEVVGHCLRGV